MNTPAPRPIKISKLDAARRQLQTAIELWFTGGDPVAVHTLAFAAYEIVHTVSKKRDPKRRTLIYDSDDIKEEHRAEYNIWMKRHANFFKHGDRDPDGVVDFYPGLSELFFMFSILGLEICGERMSTEESAFAWWININKPDILTDAGKEMIAKTFNPDHLQHLRATPKSEFLEAFRDAKRQLGR